METGIIILLAALALGVILFAAGYLKAPPDTAFIISGLGKKRILIGKAGWRIPFLERVDKLSLQVMTVDVKTSEAVPTNEFINVMVDGVANVKISSDPALLTRAAESLLGMKQPQLIAMVTQVLEGNMREIVGSVGLKEMVQDRQGVAKKITENVVPDMQKLGIEVVNFNIQNFRDNAGTIENMGIDNVEQIRKNAQIAKANAQRDIAIASSVAQQEANAVKVDSEKKIALTPQQRRVGRVFHARAHPGAVRRGGPVRGLVLCLDGHGHLLRHHHADRAHRGRRGADVGLQPAAVHRLCHGRSDVRRQPLLHFGHHHRRLQRSGLRDEG